MIGRRTRYELVETNQVFCPVLLLAVIASDNSTAEEAIPNVTPREVNLDPETYHDRIIQVTGWLDFRAHVRALYQYEIDVSSLEGEIPLEDCLTVVEMEEDWELVESHSRRHVVITGRYLGNYLYTHIILSACSDGAVEIESIQLVE